MLRQARTRSTPAKERSRYCLLILEETAHNLDTPDHARVRSTTYVTPRQLFDKKTSKPLHDRDRFSRAAVSIEGAGSKSASRGAAADALPALPDDAGRSDGTHCARPGPPTPQATSLPAQRLA